jgi:hypothetical protein
MIVSGRRLAATSRKTSGRANVACTGAKTPRRITGLMMLINIHNVRKALSAKVRAP